MDIGIAIPSYSFADGAPIDSTKQPPRYERTDRYLGPIARCFLLCLNACREGFDSGTRKEKLAMAELAQGMKTYAPSAMAYSEPDDVLVREAIGGDARSFEVLYRRHQRRVVGICRRMTGNNTDAEDIAQQTFMKAYLRLPGFQGRSSFSTWLTSVAINEARMWKRKQLRLREVYALDESSDERCGFPLELADFRPDPESVLAERELCTALVSRINRLSPAVRSVVEVCDLHEESTRATALRLGITVSAVKSRRHRGRAVLRRGLAHYSADAYRRKIRAEE